MVVVVAGLLAKVSIGASILATKTDTADSAVYASDNNQLQLSQNISQLPPPPTLSPFLYMHAAWSNTHRRVHLHSDARPSTAYRELIVAANGCPPSLLPLHPLSFLLLYLSPVASFRWSRPFLIYPASSSSKGGGQWAPIDWDAGGHVCREEATSGCGERVRYSRARRVQHIRHGSQPGGKAKRRFKIICSSGCERNGSWSGGRAGKYSYRCSRRRWCCPKIQKEGKEEDEDDDDDGNAERKGGRCRCRWWCSGRW